MDIFEATPIVLVMKSVLCTLLLLLLWGLRFKSLPSYQQNHSPGLDNPGFPQNCYALFMGKEGWQQHQDLQQI